MLASGLSFASYIKKNLKEHSIFPFQDFFFFPFSVALLAPVAFFVGGHTLCTSVFKTAVIVSVIASLIWLYFLPTVFAYKKHHPQFVPLAIVNFFSGFTLIGWAGSLAWAFWKFDKPDSD